MPRSRKPNPEPVEHEDHEVVVNERGDRVVQPKQTPVPSGEESHVIVR